MESSFSEKQTSGEPGQETGGDVPVPGHTHPVGLSLIPLAHNRPLDPEKSYAHLKIPQLLAVDFVKILFIL